MIELKSLSKKYVMNSEILDIFKDISLEIKNGKFIALKGRSGSGKSTLLKILSGLDVKYDGEYYFLGNKLKKDAQFMSEFRMKNIGVVTQNYELLVDRNCFENIALPLKLLKYDSSTIQKKVNDIMKKFDIENLKYMYPKRISGGQCQLVAMARAIVISPKIILADEPTGALDIKTEQKILNLLRSMVTENSIIIIATHSEYISDFCDEVLFIEEFKIKKMTNRMRVDDKLRL